jgi:hypothetical protein
MTNTPTVKRQLTRPHRDNEDGRLPPIVDRLIPGTIGHSELSIVSPEYKSISTHRLRALAAAGMVLLYRRARHVTVGTVNAAIARLGPEHGMAGLAFIEPLACVRRHGLPFAVAACRTGDGRFGDDGLCHPDLSGPARRPASRRQRRRTATRAPRSMP